MKRWGVLTGIGIILIVCLGMQLNYTPSRFGTDMEKVQKHTRYLSDPSLEGRLTGTTGNQKAVDYVYKSLLQIGSERENANFSLSKEVFRVPVQEFDQTPELSFVKDVETGEKVTVKYGQDFIVMNHPRSGSIDYSGDILVVSDGIYDVDPDLLKGKVVVSKLNRITDDYINDLRERGAVGILNMYTRSFDPTSTKIKLDTEINLRTDWKSGEQIFVGKISNSLYETLKESAKDNLIEAYSNLNPVKTSGSVSEKVTGYIRGVRLKAVSSYPLAESENILVKFPSKSRGKGAVILSSDIDGYGLNSNGDVLPSTAQAMTSALMLELIDGLAKTGQTPEQDLYFVFLNGSKQGDAGMNQLLNSLDFNRRVEWIHLQNLGGAGDLPITYGDANSTDSNRQWAIQLRMFMHGQNVGLNGTRGFPREYAPGFGKLVDLNIPHVLLSSGTDRYIAANTYDEVDYSKVGQVSALLESYLYRDVFGNTQPDYLSKTQVHLTMGLLVMALVFMYMNKIAKVNPSFELGGKNIRFWTNTRSFRGLSSAVYFVIPAVALMIFMIFLMLFPKMFVTTQYYGLYSGYSPYLYAKTTIEFLNRLFENGLTLEGSGAVDIRILSSLVAGSFKLIVPAIGISIVLGFIKGAIDSFKPTDGKSFLSLALLSMPDVLVAFLGLQVIIMWSKNESLVNFIPVEAMRGIVMPVLALSIIPAVYISRLALIAVEEERHKGYVKGALAKGATKWQTYTSHLLPVMMLKLLDAMPSVMKLLIANLIIVEYFYGYPGIANYLITHMGSVTLVLILSMGIGMIYLILNAFFKVLALTINPMKRRGI